MATHSWSRKWQPTPVCLPGESYGQKCLVGCSSWGHKELDMTENTHIHTNTHTHTHTHTHSMCSPGTFSPVSVLHLYQDKLPTSWSQFPLSWVRTGEGLQGGDLLDCFPPFFSHHRLFAATIWGGSPDCWGLAWLFPSCFSFLPLSPPCC